MYAEATIASARRTTRRSADTAPLEEALKAGYPLSAVQDVPTSSRSQKEPGFEALVKEFSPKADTGTR